MDVGDYLNSERYNYLAHIRLWICTWGYRIWYLIEFVTQFEAKSICLAWDEIQQLKKIERYGIERPSPETPSLTPLR